MWQKIIGLGLAGALGTIARYTLTGVVQRFFVSGFPFGTLVVNTLGCFLFGIIWTAGVKHAAISPQLRTLLLAGFLGAFTTFSAFLFETDQLIEGAQWLLAGANVASELVLGLAAYVAGAFVATLI